MAATPQTATTPWRQTLQAARDAQRHVSTEQSITVRYRTRFLHATARSRAQNHPNILHLSLAPSIIDRLICRFVRLLHWPLHKLHLWLPEWFLPSHLILKTYKDDWDEECETEVATYHQLRPVQGKRVPIFLGKLHHRGKRAILLSDIGGVCVGTPAGTTLPVSQFRQMLREALVDLAQWGILPDDLRLENLHLVDKRIMLLDFEMVREMGAAGEEVDAEIESVTNWLLKLYRDRQSMYLADGDICEVSDTAR